MQIKEIRIWSSIDVRNLCVENKWYGCGNSEEYDDMLKYIDNHKHPSISDIFYIAKNILNHTDIEETVENIMCMIANDVIKYYYEIEE